MVNNFQKELDIKNGKLLVDSAQYDGYTDVYISYINSDGNEFQLCCVTNYEDENPDIIKLFKWIDPAHSDADDIVGVWDIKDMHGKE